VGKYALFERYFGDANSPLCGGTPLGLPALPVCTADGPGTSGFGGLPYEKKCTPQHPEKFAGSTTRWGTFGGLERPKWAQNRGKTLNFADFGPPTGQNRESEIGRAGTSSNL